jgi:hypothetical protein
MLPFRQRALDRRTFLRGTGACLALPWLEAMAPALRQPRERPVRAVFVFSPNGMKMDDWKPRGEGADFELPYLLEPLAPVREHVTVITGLAIDGGRPHADGAGDHARAAASFLTCAHPVKTGGADIKAGVSADQVIAAAVGSATRFPSLELGMERGSQAGVCDSGYSCAYSNNVSWRTENTPVAKETDPRAVFARLFGDPDAALDAAGRAQQRRRERSLLDAVRADAQSLEKELGAADRQKLDQYLTSVRELEQRLQKAEPPADAVPAPEGLRGGGGLPVQLDLMYELLALALQADLTRVATFMLGNAGSNRSYPFLDVPEGHHDLSHHGGKPEKLAGLRKINRFHLERFAHFVKRMQATADGEGSLLDHCLVLLGAGIGDGDRHNHDNLPVVLVGRGGGTGGGRHLRLQRETPMANLHLAVMARMGVQRASFADSSDRLAI